MKVSITYSFFIRLAVIIASCKVPNARNFKFATSFWIIILPIIVPKVFK